MDSLRKPFFIAALILIALVVLIEIGGVLLPATVTPSVESIRAQSPDDPEVRDALRDIIENNPNELREFARSQDKPPGLGIPYMALLDGVLLFTVVIMALSFFIPEGVHGRLQGCATCLFSLLLILGSILLIFVALALIILMITLFLAVPFGTIAYLAIYGFFDRPSAAAILSLLMLLKLAFAVCLVLANQRFLQNKGLVLLVLTSLLANVVISFLHGFVPGVLVSITDGIGACLVAVLALIWALFLLIGSIVSLLRSPT